MEEPVESYYVRVVQARLDLELPDELVDDVLLPDNALGDLLDGAYESGVLVLGCVHCAELTSTKLLALYEVVDGKLRGRVTTQSLVA